MKYNKQLITKFIERYNLNGTIEAAQITSDGKSFYTLFKNVPGNLRGEIKLEKINLPEGEIGIYYTQTLLKMMSILDNDIDVKYLGQRKEDNSIINIEMSDTKGKKITHVASILALIDNDGKKGVIKDYEIKIKLNQETIQDILKAFGAINTSLDIQTIAFEKRGDKLFAIFGHSDTNSDTIEFELDPFYLDDDFDELMKFSAAGIKEILAVNGKFFEEATLEISVKGALRLYFKDGDITSEYWIKKNN